MARPTLFTHRKLPRLARLARVHISEALGLLEFLWHAQYEVCSEIVGDSLDVETLARWEGEPGALTAALRDAGFIDQAEDGAFVIHDFWDHAPDYVHKRAAREEVRKARGVTISELRAEAGRKGAEVANLRRSASGNRPANGRQVAFTPAPAPAPAPAPVRELPSEALGAEPAKKARKAPETGAIAVYRVAWSARYGAEPHPSDRDCVAANSALKSYSPDEAEKIIRAFVADEDRWLCEKAHRLGLLPGQIDRIVAGLNGKLSSGRATRNLATGFAQPAVPADGRLAYLDRPKNRGTA